MCHGFVVFGKHCFLDPGKELEHSTPSFLETPEPLGKSVIWTSHLGLIPYSLQAGQLVFNVLFYFF